MLIIISKIVFALSLLGILYIIVRKIPALSKLPEESLAGQPSLRVAFSRLNDIIKQLVSSNFFQNTIVGKLEKSLRRFKIMTLKIHNFSDKFIRKLKKNGPR